MSKIKSFLHYLRINYFERAYHDIKIALSPPSRPLVEFLGCGTQKGGTTALDAYLRQHPEICLPTKKELHFFDIDYHFRFSRVNYTKYHSYFDPGPEYKICGEITPIYMYWYDSIKRIWEYNPHMKLVILLRNPVDRSFSHWNMNRERGFDQLSFWEALMKEEERQKSELPNQHRRFSYLDRSIYSVQLRRIWHYFPKERVLILKTDHLKEKPQKIMGQIFEFLGVAPLSIQAEEDVHARNYEFPIQQKEKEYLLEYFEPEIHTLEKMLEWDCREWLS